MVKKKTTSIRGKKSNTPSGSIQVVHYGSLIETFNYVHRQYISKCQVCGKPMNRSDINDFGSLCERCYMQEYYGK